MTRWEPKTTCDCEVEYTINNSLPPDMQHGGLRCDSFAFTKKCPAHTAFTDKQLWDIIWDENPRYAAAYDAIISNAPAVLFDTHPGAGGQGTRVLKDNVALDLTWTGTAPNRILNISIVGAVVSNAAKNTMRNAIDSKIPGGKVVLA